MARVQAVSGLLFAVFLALHLATTASAPFGAFDSVLQTVRHVYRPTLVVELLLVGVSGGVHILCALVRIAQRRNIGAKGNRIILAHRLSGYVLLLFVVGHAVATRVAPLFAPGDLGGGADVSYLAFSLLNWPAFFIPYYFLLGGAGAIHFALGVSLALKALFPALGARVPLLKIAPVFAIGLCVIVTLGVGGIVLQRTSASKTRFGEFQKLYDRFVPFMHASATP